MRTSVTERRIAGTSAPPPTASLNSVSPVKQAIPLQRNESPSGEWPGVSSASKTRPPVSSGPFTIVTPYRATSSSSPATWSPWPCVVSRCVTFSPSSSTTATSGPSGAPESMNTAVPPGSSATR